MKIWEYLRRATLTDDDLADLGQQGWQLVAIDHHREDAYIFIRPFVCGSCGSPHRYTP